MRARRGSSSRAARGGRPRRTGGGAGTPSRHDGRRGVADMAKTTVMTYERVVRFVDGAVHDVLGPGRHTYRRRRTRLERVDLRPRLLPVPGQEIFTADGLTIRISAVLRLAVTDPVAYLTAAQDAQQDVYLAVQAVLRDAVNAVTLEQLLAARE